MPLTVQEYQIGQVSGSNNIVSFTIIKFFNMLLMLVAAFEFFSCT